MRRFVPLAAAGAGGVAAYVAWNIDRVPLSGRRRFISVTPVWERRIADYTFDSLMRSERARVVDPEHPTAVFVDKVLRRLLAVDLPEAPHLRGLDWQVVIINAPVVNAFVLPNGKVIVYAPILRVCQDEQGLATVLSHEVAHVVCRHGAERLSRQFLFTLPLLLMRLLLDNPGPWLQVGALANLAHSRAQEMEADHVGLLLMARACYQPASALPFWNRFAALERSAPPEWASTHPASKKRVANLKELLPEAQGELRRCCPGAH